MTDGAPPASPPASPLDDRELQLKLRERDLEERYRQKDRDLKAQHKRAQASLDADRADWERHRQEQKRELAAREERLRRAEEGRAKEQGELRRLRAEVEARKGLEPLAGPSKAELKASHRLEARLQILVRELGKELLGLGWFLLVAGILVMVVVFVFPARATMLAGLGGACLGLTVRVWLRSRRAKRVLA